MSALPFWFSSSKAASKRILARGPGSVICRPTEKVDQDAALRESIEDDPSKAAAVTSGVAASIQYLNLLQ